MVIFRFLFNNTPEKNIEKGRPIQLSKKSTCRISKWNYCQIRCDKWQLRHSNKTTKKKDLAKINYDRYHPRCPTDEHFNSIEQNTVNKNIFWCNRETHPRVSVTGRKYWTKKTFINDKIQITRNYYIKVRRKRGWKEKMDCWDSRDI